MMLVSDFQGSWGERGTSGGGRGHGGAANPTQEGASLPPAHVRAPLRPCPLSLPLRHTPFNARASSPVSAPLPCSVGGGCPLPSRKALDAQTPAPPTTVGCNASPVRPRGHSAPGSQLPRCAGATSGLHRLPASPVWPSESCCCHPAPCVSTPPPGPSQASPAARILPRRPPGRVDNSDSVRTGPGMCGRRGELSALCPARLLAALVSV